MTRQLLASVSGVGRTLPFVAGPTRPVCRRPLTVLASKGFGAEPKTAAKQQPEEEPAESSSGVRDKDTEALAALEARVKSRRKKVEAKVKVLAPDVDVATGKAAPTPQSEAEQAYVSFLGIYFILVLGSGLLLAGAGFLPEEVDQWIQDKLYPSYSWLMLSFLGFSSLYGLFKTGKLPGQKQV